MPRDVFDLVQQEIPRPEYYVQDILPKSGVMLVYGEPKVKKSWLVQHLAFCVSVGIPWLGLTTIQGRCFLSNFEISPISYQWRLKDMARNFELQPQMLYEESHMLMYLEEEHNFNTFKQWVRELQPQVIILDCLAACYGGDENDGGQMANFIEKLTLIKAESPNSSMVIVHHTNKNQMAGSSTDRARGHSRLAGWVDTLCYIAQQPTGVQLQIKARQATREVPNINIRFANYNWSVN
jgi:RecA-family ATPase